MTWKEYPLSQLTKRFISGGTPTTKVAEYWQGDIPWITGADFFDGEVYIGRRHINRVAVNNSATNIVPRGSILMVTRTGVGKIAIAPMDIAISQDITGIVLKSGLSERYILSAIKNKMAFVLAAQRGATIKGVTRKDIEILPIPLAPPSEQLRIVEILDQADALRKKRAEADAKAARILPALFYKMFGDPATNPKGWPVRKIGEVCQIVSGATPRTEKPEYWGGIIPWATPKDLSNLKGWVLESTSRKLTKEGVKSCSLTLIPEGAVILSSRAPIGLVAIAGISVYTNQGFKSLVYGSEIDPWYLFAWCKLRTDYLKSLGRGATFTEISKSIVGSINIPIPHLKKQHEFREMINLLRSIHSQQLEVLNQTEKTYQTLMHSAFTGDLTAKWREEHMKELLLEMKQQTDSLIAPADAGPTSSLSRSKIKQKT